MENFFRMWLTRVRTYSGALSAKSQPTMLFTTLSGGQTGHGTGHAYDMAARAARSAARSLLGGARSLARRPRALGARAAIQYNSCNGRTRPPHRHVTVTDSDADNRVEVGCNESSHSA